MSAEGTESRSESAVNLDLMRGVAVFSDLADDELAELWHAGDDLTYADGEVVFREGDEAVWMVAILAGEIRARRENATGRTYTLARGQVGGVLPYSRMARTSMTGRAVGATRILAIHRSQFPHLLSAIPVIGERLVGLMSDRIREVSALDQQQDKMAALGRLSAGLAHELNNPASAVLRSAEALRSAFRELRGMGATPASSCMLGSSDGLALEVSLLGLGAAPVPIDPIERLACEEDVANWLEARSVDAPWDVAPALVEAGVAIESLELAERSVGPENLGGLVRRLARHQQAERLIDEIELSARRISSLVDAVKQYSFMDQAPIGEVDVHEGLNNTLLMLAHKLESKRAVVETSFDQAMTRIRAHGVELNQVWTNLIENAVDAIPYGGSIRLCTQAQPGCIVVDVADSGTGIAPEILPRIFEPFFTTKPVGQGSGLGLDAVARIVRSHGGEIAVESAPGATHFRVTLPVAPEHD